MEISATETQAIWVALKAAAAAYSMDVPNAPDLSPALKRQDQQFAYVCQNLADTIDRTKKIELDPSTKDVVVAALRLSSRRWLDEAARQITKHDRERMGAFAMSYDRLATIIETAFGKAVLAHTLRKIQ